MTHSACARLRRAHRVRRFDEKGPARTLNRLGIGSIWIARKPTFDRLAQSCRDDQRCASFQSAGFCLGDLAGRSADIGHEQGVWTALAHRRCWAVPGERDGRRSRLGTGGPDATRPLAGSFTLLQPQSDFVDQ